VNLLVKFGSRSLQVAREAMRITERPLKNHIVPERNHQNKFQDSKTTHVPELVDSTGRIDLGPLRLQIRLRQLAEGVLIPFPLADRFQKYDHLYLFVVAQEAPTSFFTLRDVKPAHKAQEISAKRVLAYYHKKATERKVC
jgi:hypothetical protein